MLLEATLKIQMDTLATTLHCSCLPTFLHAQESEK